MRLLYQIHRWVGIVLAPFMSLWFVSGLAIIYGGSVNQSRAQQLEHAQILDPQTGWLSLGEARQRSAVARDASTSTTVDTKRRIDSAIAEARLVRIDDHPFWQVEDERGRRFAISALDGHLHEFTVEQARRIVQQGWCGANRKASAA